jgi:phage terminase large subunit
MMTATQTNQIDFELSTPKFRPLVSAKRFKICIGGRGGGRSHTIARILLWIASKQPLRILCAREIQRSIKDSVHKLLGDVIKTSGLDGFYNITIDGIKGVNGSEFIFCGLAHNATEIKSKEGIDIAWIEEAQRVSSDSWDYLIPTIRKSNSEIWISFNPDAETDPTYQRFVVNRPKNSVLIFTNLDDNKFATKELIEERDWCRVTDYDKYLWIWEGNTRKISDALIFKGKFVEEDFDSPGAEVKRFFGADWGFSQDPTVLVSSFVKGNSLYVEYEAWGVNVELDETAQLFNSIASAKFNHIWADNSRPETISHIRNRSFNISAAEKWNGSVEDGIAFLKTFERIVIHPRCKHTLEEFKLYSYKMDKLTNEPLPVIIDKNNHCIDAIRYSLGALIKQQGAPMTNQETRSKPVSSNYKKREF